MNLTMLEVEEIVVLLGALLGSVKAVNELGKDKRLIGKIVDTALGVFFGCSLAAHFHNQGSVALSAMLSLVGGVSGAVLIEVIMQMLPSVARKIIKSWADKATKG